MRLKGRLNDTSITAAIETSLEKLGLDLGELSPNQSAHNIALLSVLARGFHNGPRETISSVADGVVTSVTENALSLLIVKQEQGSLGTEHDSFKEDKLKELGNILMNLRDYSIPSLPGVMFNVFLLFQSTLGLSNEKMKQVTGIDLEVFDPNEDIDIATAQSLLSIMVEFIISEA